MRAGCVQKKAQNYVTVEKNKFNSKALNCRVIFFSVSASALREMRKVM